MLFGTKGAALTEADRCNEPCLYDAIRPVPRLKSSLVTSQRRRRPHRARLSGTGLRVVGRKSRPPPPDPHVPRPPPPRRSKPYTAAASRPVFQVAAVAAAAFFSYRAATALQVNPGEPARRPGAAGREVEDSVSSRCPD